MNIKISQFLRPLNNLNYLNNIIVNKRTSSFYNNVVKNRQKYMSPSFKTIEAYDTPLVLKKGSMEYVWDSYGIRMEYVHMHKLILRGHFSSATMKASSRFIKKK